MTTENDRPEGDAPEGDEAAAPKPAYMTQVEVNKAITGHNKRLLASIEKLVGEKLAGLAPKPPPEDDEPDDEPAAPLAGASPPGAAPPAPALPAPGDRTAKKLAALQRKFDEREKQLAALEASRAEDAARAAKQAERTALTDLLTAGGVDGKRLKQALAYLHGDPDTRRVRRGDDGELGWVDDDGELIDLRTGINAWLAGDEGAGYKPPRGAQGAGTERGTAVPAARGGRPTREDLGRAIAARFARTS